MTITVRIATAIAIGVGATVFIDAWNLLLERLFGAASLNYCLLGRWVGHMPGGVFRHRAIRSAPAKPFECVLGWITHYGIGIGLAIAFVFAIAPGWIVQPRLMPALLYGLATVAFPLFVVQPSLGLGIASSATSHPTRARIKSLGTHTVYGLGLYAWGYMASFLVVR